MRGLVVDKKVRPARGCNQADWSHRRRNVGRKIVNDPTGDRRAPNFPSLSPANAGTLVGFQLSEEGCAFMADQVMEEAPALTSTATTRQTEPAVIAGDLLGRGRDGLEF